MVKKIMFLFLIACFSLSACSTLEIALDQTPTPTTQPTDVSPTSTPTLFPTASAPGPTFSNFLFYRTNLRPANCGNTYQKIFPARILQVHARWDYANMHAGLTIRREWYNDGNLWARYDEPWDFVKYGAEGSIDDVPIFDFDKGLPPGDYELRLYINDQPQFTPESKVGFVVDKDWSLEMMSPNQQLTAIISMPVKIMIREASGTKWELVKAHEISSLAWFEDSKHILYADTDRSQVQGCAPMGIRYTLWVIDAATAQQRQFGSDNENLHAPLLSSDEKYIAALSGSGFGDACVVDLKPVFIELGDAYQETRRLRLQDFAGIPTTSADSVVYPANDGVWKDDTHFEIGLNWTCAPDNNPSGTYLFDLTTQQATRTGDLPQP